ncbi:MAG: proteasome component M29 [Bogoriella megaspora]|nr:MAG: proteasome component M29 [Bogoriella megaspora]
MASSTPSPEAKELSLVGKVELRIALADTDSKLQDILKTYLAPLLLKLASEHRSVRDKVISICQHVNSRIKPQSIKLPVAALLKQFRDHFDKSLIRHFDLLYIQQGLPRLPKAEQVGLLPDFLRGIAKDSASSTTHGAQTFNLLLQVISKYDLPPRATNEDQKLQGDLDLGKEDATYLGFWFGKLLLFNPSPEKIAPGLTSEEYRFLTLEDTPEVWDPKTSSGLNLAQTKMTIARWLASNLFSHEQRFLPAVYASADANSRISDIGDDILKRTLPNIDLEEEAVVVEILETYFGRAGRMAVRAPIRIKLLGLLNKSVRSTTFTSQVLRLVEEGLLPEHARKILTPGRETVKMRTAIFSYVNFLARRGSKESVDAVAPKLVYSLKDFIESQGWPIPHPEEDLPLRGLGYEVIGLLLKAGPRELLQEPNLELLRWLLRSLREDNSGGNISVSLEETLSTIMSVFEQIPDNEIEEGLRSLLLEQMEDQDESDNAAARSGKPSFSRSTRYVAVRFANRCLSYKDVAARWIDILGLEHGSQERHEVVEEAKKGLDPYWHLMNTNWNQGKQDTISKESLEFPDFDRLTSYLFTMKDYETIPDADETPQNEGLAVRFIQNRRPSAYVTAIRFCRNMLIATALSSSEGPHIAIDADWERKVDLTITTDALARTSLRTLLRESFTGSRDVKGQSATNYDKNDISKSTSSLIAASISGFKFFEGTSSEDADCRRQCGETFVEICSMCPNSLLFQIAPLSLALQPQMISNDLQTRMLAAQAFGILATLEGCDAVAVRKQVDELQEICSIHEQAFGAQLNQVHGAVLGLGHFFGRFAYRSAIKMQDTDFDNSFKIFLRTVVDLILHSRDSTLADASFVALDQLALFHTITLDDLGSYVDLSELAKRLGKSAKSGNEKAISCLGHLAMIIEGDGEEQEKWITNIENFLRELHEIKQAESQFAVGEAISCLACGWDSSALATKLDVEGTAPQGPARYDKALAPIIDRTLDECKQTKPSLKKAAVIWLLCLLQYCGHRPEMKERLPACQLAFKRCLSDRDTLVQESASRGLGLVYEHGDRQLKDDLVRDLVGSFSSDRAHTSGTVTEDTQLFEPGALPTGDGNSVTTYKDIMNLAAEVGDSSLVYRFMSLASNNAIWSTRAAFGRFGLSNVLSDSSVDGYLASNPKLYPKLFRYRFDPNTNVQRSMNDIWHALVKNPSATTDQYFDAIMSDLLQSILSREWRAREASCNAIADLIQAQPAEKWEKYLSQIWSLCFKVMDDIKDSVRVAAAGLARTLTGILTRSLESSTSEKTVSSLKDVLPFLLSTQGLESSAEEVRLFALHALLEIIKKASAPVLRPFIPELVEKVLGLLSTMEPEAVNYVHMNAARYNLTAQKIDDMRLASVRASPLMEAIERCLDLLDESTMKSLLQRLEAAMKSAVGMPSKVGCSRVLVSLSTRRAFLFRPHADYALVLVQRFVLDRNETVNASYAASAGYVARNASEAATLTLAGFAKQKLYFGSEDERHRVIAADVVHALAKHATDRFNALAVEFVPFVFLAKHDSANQVNEIFKEIWSEYVGGSRTVLLYLKEIMELAQQHLDSPKWILKHASARTIADSVSAVAANVGQAMSAVSAQTLWSPLRIALGGKTWEGKEVVLEAFATFVEKAPEEFLEKKEIADEIKKIAVREAKRQNQTYRPHAYEALGRVSAARTSINFGVNDIVEPVIKELIEESEDAMEVDEGKGERTEKTREITLHRGLVALGRATNLRDSAADSFLRSLEAISTIENRPTSLSLAIFEAVRDAVSRMTATQEKPQDAFLKRLSDILLTPFDGPENIRKERAKTIVALGRLDMSAESKQDIKARISEEIGKEVSPAVKHELQQARLGLST